MPFRSLKQADLRPVAKRNVRTIPRAALILTLVAQVAVWGTILVLAMTLLRSFQELAENFEMRLSTQLEVVVRAGELLRENFWSVLGVLLAFLAGEVIYFVRHRPLVVNRFAWLALLLFTLVLPFFGSLIGGLQVLPVLAKLLTEIRGTPG